MRSKTEQVSIEDEAYKVVEATNDDGTIDGRVCEEPRREGDELVLKVHPLIPNVGEKEFRFDWPNRNVDDYKAVRLARSKVGGFQRINELEGEDIKIIVEGEDDFQISVPEKAPSLSGMISNAVPSFESIITILCLCSIIGLFLPIVLALLYPFGIAVLSIAQGLSLMIGSFMTLLMTGAYLDSKSD